MNSVAISFYRGVTCRAQANEVSQPIGLLPVVIKVAPWLSVMYVHWTTQFILGYTALLASVVVTFAGLVLLPYPVGSTPFLMTALPVAMILAFLPLGGAIIATEPSGILARLNKVGTNVDRLATLLTSKIASACLSLAISATKASVTMLKAITINPKVLAAYFASDFYTVALSDISAIIRAKAIGRTANMGEFFTASLANMRGVTLGLPKALKRAKALSGPMGTKQCAADHTGTLRQIMLTLGLSKALAGTVFAARVLRVVNRLVTLGTCFHIPIIAQMDEWVNFEFAGASDGI